jgi:hypothetical protein
MLPVACRQAASFLPARPFIGRTANLTVPIFKLSAL